MTTPTRGVRHVAAWTMLAVVTMECLAACGHSLNSDALVGRWEPRGRPPAAEGPAGFDFRSAKITFDTSSWSAWDGCEKKGGGYTLSGSGGFSTSGSNDSVGCANGEVPYPAILSGVDHVRVSKGEALFYSKPGDVVLDLIAVP